MSVWTRELLKNLDLYVDEPARKKIMAACGEKCPYTHLTDAKLLEIKESSTNEDDFLRKLCDEWRLIKENDEFYVVFDQCYCPIAIDNVKDTSKTLCYCTVGNLHRKFKIGLEREVQIEIIKTILQGDNECRFHIRLKI
jgi:predicted hydrocarbon binding protein